MIEAARAGGGGWRGWIAAVPVVLVIAVTLGLVMRDGADALPVGSGVVAPRGRWCGR